MTGSFLSPSQTRISSNGRRASPGSFPLVSSHTLLLCLFSLNLVPQLPEECTYTAKMTTSFSTVYRILNIAKKGSAECWMHSPYFPCLALAFYSSATLVLLVLPGSWANQAFPPHLSLEPFYMAASGRLSTYPVPTTSNVLLQSSHSWSHSRSPALQQALITWEFVRAFLFQSLLKLLLKIKELVIELDIGRKKGREISLTHWVIPQMPRIKTALEIQPGNQGFPCLWQQNNYWSNCLLSPRKLGHSRATRNGTKLPYTAFRGPSGDSDTAANACPFMLVLHDL